MTGLGAVLQGGLPFAWAGAVAAISFIEAPLKFRAPGMTVPLAVGIGRLVFPALNKLELVLATLLVAAAFAGPEPGGVGWTLTASAAVVLLAQMFWLRPRLDARAQSVIEGTAMRKASRLHFVYVVLEVVKLVLLVTGGAVLAA